MASQLSMRACFAAVLTILGPSNLGTGPAPLFAIANTSTFGTTHMRCVLTPGYELGSLPVWPLRRNKYPNEGSWGNLSFVAVTGEMGDLTIPLRSARWSLQ